MGVGGADFVSTAATAKGVPACGVKATAIFL